MLRKKGVGESRLDRSVVMVISSADSYDATEEKCQLEQGRFFTALGGD